MERARQMMVVDNVVTLVRPHDYRDHMSAQKLALLFLRFVPAPMLAQALAFILDLHHSDRHLGRTKREDRNWLPSVRAYWPWLKLPESSKTSRIPVIMS